MATQTLIVSSRGQITLPKGLRDRLAIRPGAAVIAEEKEGLLTIRPAAVTAVRIYSDAEVKAWIDEDRVSSDERRRIVKKARSKR
jgi:AbrB family looped-hinge helix DNA binding protein